MARHADPDHPGLLAASMAPFAGCFTRPTWANLLVLAAGTILSPGGRTVAAALSSVGLRGAATFTNCHRVLKRDPVRSSRGHFVKASDLRWISLMLLVRWLPGREVIAVTDSSYAAIGLLAAVRQLVQPRRAA